MSDSEIVRRHGAVIDLGPCLVGPNLNVYVLRGFASLDVLADISAPDVYDQVDNKYGTQRALKTKHSREAFKYAMDSLAVAAEDEPRCFPEIILNARDGNVVEIYSLDDTGDQFDIDSFVGPEDVPADRVGVRIRAKDIEYPKPGRSPQISRVDGNHRLAHVDDVLEESANGEDEEDPEFPYVAFSLLIGLDALQESHLFRDINANQEGMETAHLDAMIYRILDHEEMKADPKLKPLWLAHQLAESGRAFEDMVFMGGEKTGVKKALGKVPPIKINSLKSTVAAQLKAAPIVSVELKEKPELMLELLDRYWKAVRDTFPEAWQNKRDYILLQAIGLGAFAKFGGSVLDRIWSNGDLDYDDIKAYISPLKKVSLDRTSYPGIAGAGGIQFVAELLIDAAEPDKVKTEQNIAKLGGAVGGGPTGLDTDDDAETD